MPCSVEMVDPNILNQLELYSRILHEAYPNHEICSAILWTKAAKLMRIPRMNFNKASRTFFGNQVLDDV